jgi:universal stress protein E
MIACMKRLASILAVIEPGAMAPALRKASTLARIFGARLELLFCDSEHAYALRRSYDSSGIAEARDACLAQAREFLNELRNSLATPGLEIGIEAICESPMHEGVVQHVLATRPDMVVKSLGKFLTMEDWHLVRTCPVPLMLARKTPWSEPPTFAAAVDVSDEELPGLAWDIVQTAEFLARGAHGEVDILCGTRSRAPEIEQSLLELSVEFRVSPERVHVLQGDPREMLPRWAAQSGYDVMALGALTHRPALTPFVGTLAERLANALGCDMLFIKPRSFSCPVISKSSSMGAVPGLPARIPRHDREPAV